MGYLLIGVNAWLKVASIVWCLWFFFNRRVFTRWKPWWFEACMWLHNESWKDVEKWLLAFCRIRFLFVLMARTLMLKYLLSRCLKIASFFFWKISSLKLEVFLCEGRWMEEVAFTWDFDSYTQYIVESLAISVVLWFLSCFNFLKYCACQI